MPTRIFLAGSIALLLPHLSLAVTDTWDGGGADNNVTTGANWADNTAPVSDLANTDLIFAGAVDPAPIFPAAFSTNSITFNNTAAAFTLGSGIITLGVGGVVNNDADTQTVNSSVTIGAAGVSFNAASGQLAFTNAVNIGGNGLGVTGASNTTLGLVSGAGTITKTGTGTLNLSPSSTYDFDLVQNAGNISLAQPTTFTAASSGQLNAGNFNLVFGLSLNGAQFTKAAAANFNLLTSTLTLQNAATFAITGAQNFSSAGTVNVNSGSSLTTTSFLDLANGAAVTTTLSVNGTGSQVQTATVASDWGAGGGTASVTFSNGATGNLGGGLRLAFSGAAGGATLSIQSGAQVTAGVVLNLGASTAGAQATATIDGANSKLTVSGPGSTAIGAATGATQTLNIQNGGVFDSGTGTVTIGATGVVNMNGNFLADGDTTVNGTINRTSAGFFILAPGKNLTVQNGGDLNFGTSDLVVPAGSTATLMGAGTTYTGSFISSLAATSVLNVTAGAVANIGTNGGLQASAGTILVDGAGSQLNSGGSANAFIASGGASAAVTYRNGAAGSYNGMLSVAVAGQGNATGVLNVESGADLSLVSLLIGDSGTGSTGTVTLMGSGSTITQGPGGLLTIGASTAGQGTGTLNVSGGANYTTGSANSTLLTNVRAGSALNVTGAGSTFTANAPMSVTGQVTTGAGTVFNLNRGLSVSGGGDALFGATPIGASTSSVFVTGSGSTLKTAPGSGEALVFNGVSLSVLDGAEVAADTFLNIGIAAPTQVLVSGTGSQFRGNTSFLNTWGSSGGTPTITFESNATGTFGAVNLGLNGAATNATLNVQANADVTLGSLRVANTVETTTATVNVSGGGSTLTVQDSDLILGNTSGSTAALNITDGGAVTLPAVSGTNNFVLNPTGTVNLNGGSLTLGDPLTDNGGTVNFTAGSLSLNQSIFVGDNGLLGSNLTLGPNRQLALGAGTAFVNVFNTLTLSGGALTAAALSNSGTIDFQKGTLEITGSGGFNIGTGALGANVTLGPGANLSVDFTTSVNGDAVLTLDGGTLTSATLNNSGSFRLDSGFATVGGTVANSAGGQMFVADNFSTVGTFTNFNTARLTLQNGTGRLSGAGGFTNNGLLTGDGIVAKAMTNNSVGEIRAEAGKTLAFTAANAPNAGRLNLLGGTLEFTQAYTNSSTGQINGRGALNFAGGLTNSGQMNFSAGFADVFGTVNMLAGSRLITSGGGTATFYNAFTNNGTEVRTSVGSATVFFGLVNGAGPFTGTGQVYFEGGYSPGNSPALVTLEGDLFFGAANVLTLEIGGLSAGDEYDRLVFAGEGVQFGGTVVIDFLGAFVPAEGDTFDLLDFDPALATGEFAEIVVADALPSGLSLDTSDLGTTGQVTVVPEPSTAALLLACGALALARRRRA